MRSVKKLFYLSKQGILTFCSILILIFFAFTSLNAQDTPTVTSLERSYKNGTLSYYSSTLLIYDTDTSTEKAAKSYFKAVLTSDMSTAILSHSVNFNTYPDEYYGQLSGIQLISIDFINSEYDKALQKINRINSVVVPENLYWKAKIAFTQQRYDEAISICQSFITAHSSSELVPKMWVIVLESLYHKTDRTTFERNYDIFARHQGFAEYKPYLLFLNGRLCEDTDSAKATRLYNSIITGYAASQFRVLAEDRLFALRQQNNQPPPPNPPFQNVVVNKYENLNKGSFYIQFGAFNTENQAKSLSTNLGKDKISTFTISKPVENRRMYAVIQGPYTSQQNAEVAQRKINSSKYPTFIFDAR